MDTSPRVRDDSNPQQGSTRSTPTRMHTPNRTKRTYKVPPTRRDSRKLFVGGLPSNVTEDEFREFFEQYGKVLDSVVMFDRDTHRSRGFGFVTFDDPKVSRQLLQMNEGDGQHGATGAPAVGRLVMRGKVCEVKPAEPKGRGMTTPSPKNNKQQVPYSPDRNHPVAFPGYPLPTPAESPPIVNAGVASSLAYPASPHASPVMMPAAVYGVPPPGGYYPGAPPMPMYAPPYGYQNPPYAYDGNFVAPNPNMTAPGLIAEGVPNLPYGFIPVGNQPSVSPGRITDESPQSNSTGEEMNNEPNS